MRYPRLNFFGCRSRMKLASLRQGVLSSIVDAAAREGRLYQTFTSALTRPQKAWHSLRVTCLASVPTSPLFNLSYPTARTGCDLLARISHALNIRDLTCPSPATQMAQVEPDLRASRICWQPGSRRAAWKSAPTTSQSAVVRSAGDGKNVTASGGVMIIGVRSGSHRRALPTARAPGPVGHCRVVP